MDRDDFARAAVVVGAIAVFIFLMFIAREIGYNDALTEQAKQREEDKREQERVTIDNLNARIRVLEQDHREGLK